MRRWIGVVALAVLVGPACKKKPAEDPPPVPYEPNVVPMPAVTKLESMIPEAPARPLPAEPAAGGSRDVPSEAGVPLDQTALGALPHPFGALEVVKAGMTRDEVLSALPNAQRDGESVRVPVGVESLMAKIDFDFTGHLDVVRITVPASARAILEKAWGKPTADGTWFDRKKRWRADLDGENELMIGSFVPLAEILGRGPDGLAETQAMLGATPAELTARFGNRIKETEIDSLFAEAGTKDYELLLPVTEHCKYNPQLHGEVVNGRIAVLHFSLCSSDEVARRAALASIESKWGRAVPVRTADDRPAFSFAVPRRRILATVDEMADAPGWQIAISVK